MQKNKQTFYDLNQNHLRLLTKEHYDKYTFIEPNVETNKKFIENNESFLGLLKIPQMKEPIIEVGCGTGKYLKLIEMADKRNVTGIDISPNSLKIARKYLIYSHVEEGDATNLKNFKEETFNTVICAGVAHHTPLPEKVFDECARICKPKGQIIFAVYRKYSIYYWDYLISHSLVKGIFRLKAEKLFYPVFKLWFLFLDGNWADDRLLLSKVTDRYLSPVIGFFTFRELKTWITKNNLSLLKKSFVCRKSLYTLLLKK